MNPIDVQKKLFIYVFLDIYHAKDRMKAITKYNETYGKFLFSFIETSWGEPQLRMKELSTGITYTVTVPSNKRKMEGTKVNVRAE